MFFLPIPFLLLLILQKFRFYVQTNRQVFLKLRLLPENLCTITLLKQDQGSQVAPQVAKYPHAIPLYPLNQILQLLMK